MFESLYLYKQLHRFPIKYNITYLLFSGITHESKETNCATDTLNEPSTSTMRAYPKETTNNSTNIINIDAFNLSDNGSSDDYVPEQQSTSSNSNDEEVVSKKRSRWKKSSPEKWKKM